MPDEFEWLPEWVAECAALPRDATIPHYFDARFERFLSALEQGAVRAAIRDDDGVWRAVPWVKQGILLGFRFGHTIEMSPPTLPLTRMSRSSLSVASSVIPISPRVFGRRVLPTMLY